MGIDATCIDQPSDVERDPPVAVMGNLYRRVEHVVVWLRPEGNDSERPAQLMEAIGGQVDVDFNALVTTFTYRDLSYFG
jgi:hypothetical protein